MGTYILRVLIQERKSLFPPTLPTEKALTRNTILVTKKPPVRRPKPHNPLLYKLSLHDSELDVAGEELSGYLSYLPGLLTLQLKEPQG